MSGPKSSVYTLTLEQRRIIMEELRRQQQILAERSRIASIKKELCKLPSKLDTVEKNAILLRSRTGKGDEYVEKITSCRIETAKAITADGVFSESASPEQLKQQRVELEKTLRRIEKEVSAINQHASTISLELNADINQSVDKGFTTSFARMKPIVSPLNKMRSELQAELEISLSRENLPSRYQERIQIAISKVNTLTSIEHLSNFRTMVVAPLIHECDAYSVAWEKDGESYTELSAKYDALCQLCGAEAKQIPFSENACDQLEKLIEAEEKKNMAAEEQSYIRTSIDEVMQEMGYDLLGKREVSKRNGKRFRNELYSFSEGTAVNVTYASDGSIVMELGGIDDTDRIPNRDESERLCRDMNTFCGEFKEIEKRLEERGVVLGTRIGLLPPDATYAQIINTGDYNMERMADSIRVKKKQIKQKKVEHRGNE